MKTHQVLDVISELFSHGNTMVYACKAHGDFAPTYVSPNIVKQLGYTVDEFLSQSSFWIDRIHPDDKQRILDDLDDLFKEGHHELEYRFLHKDGSYHWMQDRLVLLKDETDTPTQLIGYWFDISEKKRAQLDLQISEEKFRTLTENIPGIVYRCGQTTPYYVEIISELTHDITGYHASEFNEQTIKWADIIFPDDLSHVEQLINEAVENRSPFVIEYRIRRKDGGIRWVFERGKPVYDSDGTPLWLDGVILDITEKKQAEMEHHYGEQRLRNILDTVVDGIITINRQGIVQTFNPAAEQIFGYHSEEVVGNNVNMLMPEPYHKEHNGYIQSYLETEKAKVIGIGREVTGLRKDGTTFPIDLAVSEMIVDGEQMFTGVVRDISASKEAEQALHRTETRLAAAVDNIDDGFIVCDENGRILMFNKKYARLYPNSRDLLKPGALYEDVIRGGAERGEFPAALGRIEEWITELKSTLQSEEKPVIELELIGNRWVRISGGKIPTGGRLWIHSDITASKQAEQVMQEAKQLAEEANQAKSLFLSSMSHELRTPLNAVIGYSELLKEEAQDLGQEAFVPDLEKIQKAAHHLLDLINDILDLSKIEAGKIELDIAPVEVDVLIRDIVMTVQPLVKKNGNRLIEDIDDELGKMQTDQTRLTQVLFNLLSNASKFTQAGEITLAVKRETIDDVEHMIFHVRDTGIGMSEEQQARIFEAFTQAEVSTTKQYGGTGLGLSISHQFCQLMGGTLEVQSEPGVGSLFTVSLPILKNIGSISSLEVD